MVNMLSSTVPNQEWKTRPRWSRHTWFQHVTADWWGPRGWPWHSWFYNTESDSGFCRDVVSVLNASVSRQSRDVFAASQSRLSLEGWTSRSRLVLESLEKSNVSVLWLNVLWTSLEFCANSASSETSASDDADNHTGWRVLRPSAGQDLKGNWINDNV